MQEARRGTSTPGQLWLRILPRLQFEGDCWLWKGSLRGGNRRGRGACYGQISIHGRPAYVHRVMYEIFHGSIPSGQVVDHTHVCGLGRCVNPKYLSITSHRQNSRYAAEVTNHGTRDSYNETDELGGM